MFIGDNLHVLGHLSVQACQNIYVGMFSDTINVINVKLCMMELHFQLYLFIILPETLTLFEGHNSVTQLQLKILCSYPIKLKLHRTVKYGKNLEIVLRNRRQTMTQLHNIQALWTLYFFVG